MKTTLHAMAIIVLVCIGATLCISNNIVLTLVGLGMLGASAPSIKYMVKRFPQLEKFCEEE